MIGKKDPFIQILRTTNFSSHVEEYADGVHASYDKMTLPKIGSRLDELTKNVDSQIKINNTVKSLNDNKIHEKLSNKLKELCDLLDEKYSSRVFKEESDHEPLSAPPNVEIKKEDLPTATDV